MIIVVLLLQKTNTLLSRTPHSLLQAADMKHNTGQVYGPWHQLCTVTRNVTRPMRHQTCLGGGGDAAEGSERASLRRCGFSCILEPLLKWVDCWQPGLQADVCLPFSHRQVRSPKTGEHTGMRGCTKVRAWVYSLTCLFAHEHAPLRLVHVMAIYLCLIGWSQVGAQDIFVELS